MEFIDSVFDFDTWRAPEHPVYQALFADEERAQQALDALETPLSLQEAARCLQKSLRDCAVETFRQVLDHSEPGECVEQFHLHYQDLRDGIQGSGSMLLLAAMMDRPQQAMLLLERGYDCNGAGLNLADALQKSGRCWGAGVLPYVRYSGSAGCQLQLLRYKQSNLSISCATPLSAALLCGSLQTAEVLLRQNGIWKGESSALCRAAVMVLEGATREVLPEEQQAHQLEILRQIFCPELEQLPDRETFLRRVYLQPASFVDFCGTRTLRCQLESGLCTEEDARQMLEILGGGMWWPNRFDRSRAGKLLLLKQYFPALCRADWAAGIFLRESAWRIREKLPFKTVLNAWKQLSGKERDLTWIGGDLWCMGYTALRNFLREAGEGGTLVMDADAMNHWYGASPRCMLEVLKQVRFRQRDGAGVSGLMQHVLHIRDLRAMRQAVKLGLLDREDPKLLLDYLVELEDWEPDLRAMVLAFARNASAPDELKSDWQAPRRWSQWCLWEQADDETAQQLLRELLYQDLSRETCLKTLFRLHQYLDRGVFAPDVPLEHPDYPTLQADSLAGFACCAETGQVMALLLEHLPEKLLTAVRANWGERFFFRGSPLTLAAAMGRTEQLRLLLDSGVQPDEVGRGEISRFFVRQSNFSESGFPVTPVLAAILFGQEEAAKLLLERGAVCDFSRPDHRRVLFAGSAETLALAERLPGVGFAAISAEELAGLRTVTAAQGERTLFWNSLRQTPVYQGVTSCAR